MLRAVLVDDEIAALRSLEFLLRESCPNVQVVATARSGLEAVTIVTEHDPDIVFLDVEMPKGNGFDFLEQSPNLNFEVIFVTAYNQYAVRAFKYSAIDYILKPIDIDELVLAVGKATEFHTQKVNSRARYNALFDNLNDILPKKIVIRNEQSFESIDSTDVLFIETLRENIRFTLVNSKEFMVPVHSVDIDSVIDSLNFCEITGNLWVNLSNVNRVDRSGNGSLIMSDSSSFLLPENTKETVIERLTSFNLKQ